MLDRAQRAKNQADTDAQPDKQPDAITTSRRKRPFTRAAFQLWRAAFY